MMSLLFFKLINRRSIIYITLCLLFVFTGFYSSAQLKPDFTADPVSGCAPLVVSFNNSSSGNPTSYFWDLGNGTTSTLENPSTTYFNSGTYTIKLIIKNSLGSDSIIKAQYITVYPKPVSKFIGAPLSGCFPLKTQFTDQSTAGGSSIVKWEWDFGDGVLSTSQNPEHIYNSIGNYNVSLRVTNSNGCVTSVTNPSYIHIASGAKAAFTSSASSTCSAPATVNFINNSTGNGTLTYQWDFGDSSTSTLPNPSHVFNSSGSFTIRLIVSNSVGCSDTLTKTNFVTIGTTKADFTYPTSICEGASFNLTNTSNPIPGDVLWSFGDGTSSTVISPTKVYNKSGTFTIKMVANFGACKDSVSKNITVTPKPTIDFSASPTVSCKAPLTVNFTNATPDGASFLWDFGDKTTSTEANPSHTYLAEGSDTVKLTVTTTSGCVATKIVPDLIKIKKPDISIKNLPTGGCAPFSHTFNAVVKSNDVITGYLWNFGDGSTSNTVSPTHVYNTPGTYAVTLVYTTDGGCTDSIRIEKGVKVGSKPKAALSADILNTCATQSITFQDLSTGAPNEWFWSFGDGSSSAEQNPKHQYADTGFFTITLIAINNGCPDTIVEPKYVFVKAPIAKFTYSKTCSIPGNFVFTDKSINADTWVWNFGDGTSKVTDQNPTHLFASPGTYAVSLTVTNTATGCSYIKTQNVKVITETAGFTNTLENCKNSLVTFTAANINPLNINLYTWKFGDGKSDTSSIDTIKHIYTQAGGYNVTLIIKDIDGCVDSVTKPLAVQIEGPTAFFRSTVPAVCRNSAVTFFDSSYGTSPIKQWNWNWGDGTSQTFTSPPFTHIYDSVGKYSVTLTVTDTKGCSNAVRKINELIVSQPTANFSADTLSCTSYAVNFFNYSEANPGSVYTWNFGDSSAPSSDENPVHLYPKEGTYGINLTVTDVYGCSDSETKTNYVKIGNPVADFTLSDSTSNCPPLIVNITNNSTNYATWKWDFGDGTTAAVLNPSHFYSQVGTFDVVLTISSAGTCIAKKTKQITIDGPEGTFAYTNIIGCTPLETQFSVKTGKNISYVWDFNDGNTVKTNVSQVSHTYTSTGHYLPRIILRNAEGCSVPIIGKDSIRVLGVLADFTHTEETLCDFGTVQFTDASTGNDPIVNYAWNFGDGSTSANANPAHVYQQPGNYNTMLTVTTEKGCKDTIRNSLPVKINESPKVSIVSKEGTCVQTELNFTGILSNPDTSTVSWQWNFANGNLSNQQNPVTQTYSTAGLYTVNLIANKSNGCSDTAKKIIEIYSLPNLIVTPDMAICVGSTATLEAAGAESYSWSPSNGLSCTNCANTSSKPDSTTTYVVRGTSNRGCVSTDSVDVIVKLPFKLSVSQADTLCIGKFIQLNASGSEEYTWSPTQGLNNPSISSPTASPVATTTYQVIASDSLGCFKDTGYIPVSVYPIPVVNAGEDQTINVGRQTDIVPQISEDVTNVLWTPSTGIIAHNNAAITVKPKESIEYTIQVKNEGGCTATDQVTVHVLCNNANIFIPNTFSPNGDGANDVFYPRGSGLFKIKNLKVYNRWGEIVFEKSMFNANDETAGWDGTFKGTKLSPDVYIYMLEVVCDNNSSIMFKGNISLVK